jgi:hypothetical protein
MLCQGKLNGRLTARSFSGVQRNVYRHISLGEYACTTVCTYAVASSLSTFVCNDLLLGRHLSCRGGIDLIVCLVKSLSEIAYQLLRLRICAEEVSLVSEEFRKAAARQGPGTRG